MSDEIRFWFDKYIFKKWDFISIMTITIFWSFYINKMSQKRLFFSLVKNSLDIYYSIDFCSRYDINLFFSHTVPSTPSTPSTPQARPPFNPRVINRDSFFRMMQKCLIESTPYFYMYISLSLFLIFFWMGDNISETTNWKKKNPIFKHKKGPNLVYIYLLAPLALVHIEDA